VGERLAVDPGTPVLVVGAEQTQHALEDQPGAHPGQQPRRAVHHVGVDREPVGGELADDVGVGDVRAGHEECLRSAEAVHRGCRRRRPCGGGGHGVVVTGDGQHRSAGRGDGVVGADPPGGGTGADQLGHEVVADPDVGEGGQVRGVGVDVEQAGTAHQRQLGDPAAPEVRDDQFGQGEPLGAGQRESVVAKPGDLEHRRDVGDLQAGAGREVVRQFGREGCHLVATARVEPGDDG
jgi:hypothetical protein